MAGFVFILRFWRVLCSSFGPGGFCVHPLVLAGFVFILRSWRVLCSSFGPGGFCVHPSVLVGFVLSDLSTALSHVAEGRAWSVLTEVGGHCTDQGRNKNDSQLVRLQLVLLYVHRRRTNY